MLFEKGYKPETLKEIDKDKIIHVMVYQDHKLQGKPCENINALIH